MFIIFTISSYISIPYCLYHNHNHNHSHNHNHNNTTTNNNDDDDVDDDDDEDDDDDHNNNKKKTISTTTPNHTLLHCLAFSFLLFLGLSLLEPTYDALHKIKRLPPS